MELASFRNRIASGLEDIVFFKSLLTFPEWDSRTSLGIPKASAILMTVSAAGGESRSFSTLLI